MQIYVVFIRLLDLVVGDGGSQCLKSKSLIHKKPCFFFFFGSNWQLWVVEVFVLVQMFHNQEFEDVHFLSKSSTEEEKY